MTASFAELYAWLTTDPEAFWSAIVEFFASGRVAVRFGTPSIPETTAAFLTMPSLTRRGAGGDWPLADARRRCRLAR